jgi:hypothetical protein
LGVAGVPVIPAPAITALTRRQTVVRLKAPKSWVGELGIALPPPEPEYLIDEDHVTAQRCAVYMRVDDAYASLKCDALILNCAHHSMYFCSIECLLRLNGVLLTMFFGS